MKVLVAYESVHGSTRSIAENVSRALGASAVVTTSRMHKVDSLEDFDAFVFGSPEASGPWSPQACEFLWQHSSELAGKPVWLFSVGNSEALPRLIRSHHRRRELRRLHTCSSVVIHAQDAQVFTGLVRPERPARWINGLWSRVWLRQGDYRDWTQIMHWADDIASTLTSKAT